MKNPDLLVLGYLMDEIGAFLGQADTVNKIPRYPDLPRMACTDNQTDDLALIFHTARDFASPTTAHEFVKENSLSTRNRMRLEALLSRIRLDDAKPAKTDVYFFPISELIALNPALYPRPPGMQGMTQKSARHGNTWLSRRDLSESYRNLTHKFAHELSQLQSFPADADQSKLCKSLTRSLLNLCEYYCSLIPADHPGVSLFDRIRAAAAIAEGLYLYHAANQYQSDYADSETPKWLLVCGEIKGIQTAIRKIPGNGDIKSLFGWSWFLQLLCIGLSEHIIRKLDLNVTARICSAGTRFHLLTPIHLINRLTAIADGINKSFFQEFQGEVFLGLGFAELCGQDFKKTNFGACWHQAAEDLSKNLLQPYKNQITEDENFFKPRTLASDTLGKAPGHDNEIIEDYFPCRPNFEKLAKALANSRCLLWTWGEDRNTVANTLITQHFKIALPGADSVVYLLENTPDFSKTIDLSAAHLEYLRDWPGSKTNTLGYSQGIRRLTTWKTGSEPDDARAIETGGFGVLHLDVDNLNEIFLRGLTSENGGCQSSLPAIAALSRQLHLFFNGYLANPLADHKSCEILFAGGGDALIIGDWRELPKAANAIRAEFRNYCGFNPAFTLSAGIAMAGGKYPLSHAMALAEQAMGKAKNLQRGAKQKDALCFLDTCIGWESFPDALELLRAIETIARKTRGRTIIHRLREVVIALENLEKRRERGNIGGLVQCDQWLWRLIYNLTDLKQNFPAVQIELNSLLNLLTTPQNPRDRQAALNWLPLPVNWADFLLRIDTNERRNEILY